MTHTLRVCALAPDDIAQVAATSLYLELDAYPKPGLVSPVDSGSHTDMDIGLMRASVRALQPWFGELARAGAQQAGMSVLREIGMAAERAMLAATGGVNAHRGAIFGIGLLAAAAGASGNTGESLGSRVARLWGADIRGRAPSAASNGGRATRRYGVGGASAEAAAGFPTVYEVALPALRTGLRLAGGDRHAARIHALFALIAIMDDTNLLHRAGAAGLAFAQAQAHAFLASGSVGAGDWRSQALAIHRAFVDRNLSPGGAADLLAMAIFVEAVETP